MGKPALRNALAPTQKRVPFRTDSLPMASEWAPCEDGHQLTSALTNKGVAMGIASRTLRFGAAGLLVVGMAACSNPLETVASKVIEDQTGLKIDQDGENSYTVSTEDGEFTVAAGGEVPADFPAEVPLPPGNPSGSSSSPEMWSLFYEDIDRAEVDALINQVLAAGFTENSSTTMESTVQSTYQKGDLAVTVLWSGASSPPSLIYGAMITN